MSFNWLVSAFTFLSSCDESRPFNTELLIPQQETGGLSSRLKVRFDQKSEQEWTVVEKFNICAILSQKFQHTRSRNEILEHFGPIYTWKISWKYRDNIASNEISLNIVCIGKKQYRSGVVPSDDIDREWTSRWLSCRNALNAMFPGANLYHMALSQ